MDGEPAGMPGLSATARHSLARLGLLRGGWPERLAAAGPELARFINHFHDVAGVGRVIEEYFAGAYQRAVARMAVRLSEWLAARDPDFRRGLRFDRRIAFAPDGQPIHTIAVNHRGVTFRLFPWRRLHRAALFRQLRRDRLVFGSTERVRWVFSRHLAPSAAALAGRMRAVLAAGPARRDAPPFSERLIILL
jgi:hypothetical protein